ncbi:MAG: TonB-dependent receptor plug domain-containing protein, partial [Bacteroidota bacterium]
MKKIVFTGMLMFVMMSFSAFAQTSISGTVTDADDGTSLPGVSVVVKGTTSGTITNADGTYQIDAPGDATLVFSFVGYNTTEVPVDGRTTIDIALQSALVGLEEVIVIAYGTTTRESFTGVADVISNEKIERRPVSNISRALEGVAPGVQVSSSSGQPGEGDAIRLRGFGSVSSSNAPLYVLDGVPFDGTLNSINPSDIENVSILRDASASALYGARGANGVIIITTKKG